MIGQVAHKGAQEGVDSSMRYWIGVVSQDHVRRGVADGFAQLCHGKRNPLARMGRGDWLVYYSPRSALKGGEIVQAFTAVGQLPDDEIYPFRMSETFVPYRRRVNYLPCEAAPIKPLLPQLAFVQDLKHWGYQFRFGHFGISVSDFQTIADAMNVRSAKGVLALETEETTVRF